MLSGRFPAVAYIENTMFVSFDIKFVQGDQKKDRNSKLVQAIQFCQASVVNSAHLFSELSSPISE